MEPPLNAHDEAAPGLGLATFAAPDKAAGKEASPYRVLARKYRPARFEDLIGQEAMVRTLSNAFDLDRIHQAYILTGVRGVGRPRRRASSPAPSIMNCPHAVQSRR